MNYCPYTQAHSNEICRQDAKSAATEQFGFPLVLLKRYHVRVIVHNEPGNVTNDQMQVIRTVCRMRCSDKLGESPNQPRTFRVGTCG